MKTTVRIATRKSPLALWQANFVKDNLRRLHPELEVELLAMLTTADRMLATPLNRIGGKGLFVKELEKAIMEHQADIAVHSIKDMPAKLPESLELAVVFKREDPRDVFISDKYNSVAELPSGAVVGTSSLRRKAQLLALRKDLLIKPLRGNVGTRLMKLEDNEFDAIILAAAGIKRLNLQKKIKSYFSTNEMLPAAGQGALGIECRCLDSKIFDFITPFEDKDTRDAILAERTVVKVLGGSCQYPIAAYAIIKNSTLFLDSMVSDFEGNTILRSSQCGPRDNPSEIALQAANDLIAQGALELLSKLPISEAFDDFK